MKHVMGVSVKFFFIVPFLILMVGTKTYAQSTYDNNVFDPNIKSIELYNSFKQGSFPIYNLNSTETVTLAFDDLLGGDKVYNYTLEHCDENWNSSDLSPAEYLKSFTEDKISSYKNSTTPQQKYIHYTLKIPNENIAPKIAGNYILKVYEGGDQSQLVFTRKLYVSNPQIGIDANVVASINSRQTHQKVTLKLNFATLKVQNPSLEIHAQVLQNGITETGQLNTDSATIVGNEMTFDGVSVNDFFGGNEFRHFDTRTLKSKSERVLRISRDSNTVVLITDQDRSLLPYTFQHDLNGDFYVLNQDGTDPTVDADYSYVIFSLATNKSPDVGSPYIIGQFNNFKIDEQSKMFYSPKSGKYILSQYLKQGVYDYRYVWVSFDKPDYLAFEGSHFETENDYYIMVYYQPAGQKWQELAGYKVINTGKNPVK